MKTHIIEYGSSEHAARAAAAFNSGAGKGVSAKVDGRTVLLTPSSLVVTLVEWLSGSHSDDRPARPGIPPTGAHGMAG